MANLLNAPFDLFDKFQQIQKISSDWHPNAWKKRINESLAELRVNDINDAYGHLWTEFKQQRPFCLTDEKMP